MPASKPERRQSAVEAAGYVAESMHTSPSAVDFNAVALQHLLENADVVTLSTIRATGRLMMEAVDDERERRGRSGA